MEIVRFELTGEKGPQMLAAEAVEAAAKAAPAADPQWGKQSYSNTTPPAEIEKSQNSAMDWYANPSAAARGSS